MIGEICNKNKIVFVVELMESRESPWGLRCQFIVLNILFGFVVIGEGILGDCGEKR